MGSRSDVGHPDAESLAELIDRLTARGYTLQFRAVEGGLLATHSGCRHEPEALRVEESARFEGISDPDDMSLVFALRCDEHDARGTYVVPYGPGMPPLDAEMVRRLGEGREPA